MEEIWKDIPGFEELYQVSNLGNILKVNSGKILSPILTNRYYYRIGLTNCRKRKYYLIHRLVLNTFRGLDETDQVDHINKNKLDNNLENLRIVTHRENNKNKYNNTSHIGTFLRKCGNYSVRIQIKGKLVHFGTFSSQEKAIEKYNEISEKLYFYEKQKLSYSYERIKITRRSYDIKIINL